jgi:hypothetical protein
MVLFLYQIVVGKGIKMLKYIAILLILPAIALADDLKSGGTYYHSDGSWTQEVRPGTYRHSDGTIYQKQGDRYYDTKGGTTVQQGNTTVQRDGSIIQRQGNTYYDSKGGISNRSGNVVTHSKPSTSFGWTGGTYIKKK